MEPRCDRRTRNTKERLFAAALDLFAAKGVDAVSVRDIVKRVGISTAAFYNHFASKDELLRAVHDHYREALIEPRSRAGTPPTTLPEGIDVAGIVAGYAEGLATAMTNPVLEKLARIITMEKDRSSVAAEISFDDRRRLLRGMEELFVAMEDRGLVRGGNARVLGRILAYAQIGLAEDSMYYRHMKGLSVKRIVKRQNDEMALFMNALTGG